MLLEKLYKRTTTGATQVWFLEIEGDRYRTHCGRDGGMIVTSVWTVCVGRNIGRANATVPSEQAALEVTAEYTKKRKQGYCETAAAAQESTRFSPMLAKKFEDYEAELFGDGLAVFSQPKLDGIRCVARRDGLWSRQGNPIVAVPHIAAALAPLFETWPGLILDGELYSHELKADFNAIVSAVKKQKPTAEDLERSAAIIQYWVYDTAADEPFSRRTEWITGAIRRLVEPGVLVPLDTHRVSSRPELDALYLDYLSDGFEGQIVRRDTPYEQKRTKGLLKRKEFDSAEFTVLDIEEGVGNASGTARSCTLRLDIDPARTFKADVVGTREHTREILTRRPALLGKQATVKFFKQRTPDGIPRFGKVQAFHETERL